MSSRQRGRVRTLAVAVLFIGVAFAACTPKSDYVLPSSNDPAVRAEEARVSAMLGAPGRLTISPSTCRTRLLGRDGTASFVWAVCEGTGGEAVSTAVAVRGDAIERPADGSGYTPTVRRIFPAPLADRILAEPTSLHPGI